MPNSIRCLMRAKQLSQKVPRGFPACFLSSPAFPAVLADGALTTALAKVCPADGLLTEKNCLFPSKPESFRLHRKPENTRKKPRHPKMTRLS